MTAITWPLLWEMCVAHEASGPRLREAPRPPWCSHSVLYLGQNNEPPEPCDWRILVPADPSPSGSEVVR